MGTTRTGPHGAPGEELVTYPNPFNVATVVTFPLTEESHVRVDVFDILGRRVASLVNDVLPAGPHHATWDASDAASGVYFVRLLTREGRIVKKLALVR